VWYLLLEFFFWRSHYPRVFDMMVELINAGFATAQTERIVAGSYQSERARMRITEAGRRALGGITTSRLVGGDEA
jgi:hypothetical protein